MKKSILFIVLSFYVFANTAAQDENFPDGITYKLNFVNFSFPVDKEFFNYENYSTGVELGYIRNLGSLLNLSVPLKLSSVDLPVGESFLLRLKKEFSWQ